MTNQYYTLAFTTYNSSKYIIEQLKNNYFVLSHDKINEIIIQDDCSDDYDILNKYITDDRVCIFQNSKNLSPLLNRIELLKNCSNDWVFLMDSDNFLEKNIFEKLDHLNLDSEIIYCPDFAKPNFNFKHFGNKMIDLGAAKEKLENLDMQIFLNTGNYLVNKNNYLNVAKLVDPCFAYWAVDVIYFNFLWLTFGYKLFCVKDYEYIHTMRGDSYWMKMGHKSKPKLEEVMNLYRVTK